MPCCVHKAWAESERSVVGGRAGPPGRSGGAVSGEDTWPVAEARSTDVVASLAAGTGCPGDSPPGPPLDSKSAAGNGGGAGTSRKVTDRRGTRCESRGARRGFPQSRESLAIGRALALVEQLPRGRPLTGAPAIVIAPLAVRGGDRGTSGDIGASWTTVSGAAGLPPGLELPSLGLAGVSSRPRAGRSSDGSRESRVRVMAETPTPIPVSFLGSPGASAPELPARQGAKHLASAALMPARSTAALTQVLSVATFSHCARVIEAMSQCQPE